MRALTLPALILLLSTCLELTGQNPVHIQGTNGKITPCLVDNGGTISGCTVSGVNGGGQWSLVSGSAETTVLTTANALTGVSSTYGPCTFAPLAGAASENAYIYVSTSGEVIRAATNQFTASGTGCSSEVAAGQNPANTFLLYTWGMTGGAFNATPTTDWRTQTLVVSPLAGTGITLSGGNLFSIDTTTVQQFSSPKTVTTASYTVLDSDRNSLLVFTNVGAVSVTLPQAGASGQFVAGWKVEMQCLGCGGVTVTPTTSTINGSATLSVPASVWARVTSDGANYNGATTQGAVGPIGPTGPVSNSGTLTNNNVLCGAGTTVVTDCGYAKTAVVRNDGDITLTSHALDATGETSTAPAKTGTTAAIPATCTAGQFYYATDATAGRNLYLCTAVNTWTPVSYSAGTGLSLSSANQFTVNPLDSTTAVWTDDFNYGTLSSGGIGRLGWAMDKLGTNSCTTVAGTPVVHHPGVVSMSTSATGATDGCSMNLANGVQSSGGSLLSDISATGDGNWELRAVVQTFSTITNSGLFVGLNTSALTYRGTHFAGIRYDTSGLACTGTGNADATHWVFEVDSTCVASAVTVATSTWYWMRIVSVGGAVSMDVSTTPTFSGPTSVASMYNAVSIPVMQAQNRTTASIRLSADWFSFQITGMTR